MWERGARHNPLSNRYRYYLDHRPILPQDPTLEAWGLRKLHDPTAIFYMVFKSSDGFRYLISNNLQAKDKENVQIQLESLNRFLKGMKWFSLIPAIFVASPILYCYRPKYKAMNVVVFGATWAFSYLFFSSQFLKNANDIFNYYYYKYEKVAHADVEQIEDPKRKHFMLDTSVYYRQSPQEVVHEEHHKGTHDHHDSSTYYGPSPYNDFENLDDIVEIDRKFKEGVSVYDDANKETVLGEAIDIKRVIRGLPSFDEYKKI